MERVLIDNLSERVLNDLKNEAAATSRQISEVAAERISRSFGDFVPHELRDADALLRLADAVRAGDREAWLTPEYIRAAREDGRA